MCALCWLGPFRCVGWFWRFVCSLTPRAVLAFCPSFASAFFFLLPFRVVPAPAGCVCVTTKGRQSQSRGHGSYFPSHANEAMGFSRKGMWTHIPVPAFVFVWRGAKPRTPKTENFVLHGCRNLRFSSASYSTLFAFHFYSHGEGLSREPYSDFFRILDII